MISKLKASFVAMLVFALPLVALAEEANHAEAHGEGGVPMSVLWQAINFVLYVAILIYFLKNPVKSFFASRHEAYERALVKADQARKDAERRKHEVEDRLAKLENSSTDTLANAKTEAGALVAEIQKQAEDTARRLREEATRSVGVEISRAKTELRAELLLEATQASKRVLEEKIQAQDQKRLQTEFVDKVQNNKDVSVQGAR